MIHGNGTYCEVCGAVVSSSKHDIQWHIHNQEDYLCGECLTSETNLRMHRKNCQMLPKKLQLPATANLEFYDDQTNRNDSSEARIA